MPKSISIAVDIPQTTFAQNVEWLASDFAVDDLGKFRCNIVTNNAVAVDYTVNSGGDWIKINEGKPLVANAGYGFDLYVRAGDLLNFRTPTGGGTTVILGLPATVWSSPISPPIQMSKPCANDVSPLRRCPSN